MCAVVSENRFWHVLCVPQWTAGCKCRRFWFRWLFPAFTRHSSDEPICTFSLLSAHCLYISWLCQILLCFVTLWEFLVADLLIYLPSRCLCFAKLWFPGHQISYMTEWVIEWVIEYVIFLHGLAQQWRSWKMWNFAQR